MCMTGMASAQVDVGIGPREEPGDMKEQRLLKDVADLASPANGWYAHEKTYFAVGGGDELDAKFQVSFKFRIANRVFFGYSQANVWDLHSESKPFRDTSFRPSLFYYLPSRDDAGRARLGYAAGYEHESNGKAGTDSRSIHILFVRPVLPVGPADEYHWLIAPKLYAYLSKEGTTSDLQKYRGFADLFVAWQKDDGLGLAVTGRKGTQGGRGSVTAELSWPAGRWITNMPGYFYAQLFSGWGETLLDYNVRSDTQFRVGFMAVRDTW